MFGQRLDMLERDLLAHPRHNFDIARIHKIKRQLERMRRLVRPVCAVIRHCIDDMEGFKQDTIVREPGGGPVDRRRVDRAWGRVTATPWLTRRFRQETG